MLRCWRLNKPACGNSLATTSSKISQTEFQSKIKMELQELDVYSEYLITMPNSDPAEIDPFPSSGFFLQVSRRDPARRKGVWLARDRLPHAA
jgi:hypothetical protein